MKIIDLLNKIANDDERPEMIKVNNRIWRYDYSLDDYIDDETEHYLMDRYNMLKCLNYEVEIIEKEKKIPEKLDDFNLTTYSRDDEDLGLELNYTGVSNTFNDVYFKINEIIDYLKSKGE